MHCLSVGRLMDGDHISKEYVVFSEECNPSETTQSKIRIHKYSSLPFHHISDLMDQKDNGVCYKVFEATNGTLRGCDFMT